MIQFSKYIKLIGVILILLLGCNCTPISQPPIETEGIKPLWSTELPGKAGVYNDGLVGMPI